MREGDIHHKSSTRDSTERECRGHEGTGQDDIRMSVPVIEKHGCLRMLDDLKNGRLRAPIEPQKGQDVKEARAFHPTYHGSSPGLAFLFFFASFFFSFFLCCIDPSVPARPTNRL